MTSREKNISFESSGKASDCERLVIFMGGFDPRGQGIITS